MCPESPAGGVDRVVCTLCTPPWWWCVQRACPECSQLLSHLRLSATPWNVTCQARLSMRFSRREYWSGLPCPPPGDLPQPETEPASLVSFALPLRTREIPGRVGYPAFAPGSLKVTVGLLVFLYLAHNLSQLHMCVIIFINSLIISHYFVASGINASTTAKGARSQVPGCLTHSIRPQPSTRKPSEGYCPWGCKESDMTE